MSVTPKPGNLTIPQKSDTLTDFHCPSWICVVCTDFCFYGYVFYFYQYFLDNRTKDDDKAKKGSLQRGRLLKFIIVYQIKNALRLPMYLDGLGLVLY